MGNLFSRKSVKKEIKFIDLKPTRIIKDERIDSLSDIKKVRKNLEYENLVLEGGGIKGVAYCGAFNALEECGVYKNFKNIAGSSAGAIVGSLVALGYSNKELQDFMTNFDFTSLIDDKVGFIRDGINFVKDFGVAEGAVFLDEMGKLVEEKTGDPDYTFKQLYEDTGKTLVIVGCDLEKQKAVYFWHGYSPDLSIRMAVRISMSFPFVFEPVKFNDTFLVDGGFADVFPLHSFDGEYPGDPNAIRNLSPPNPKTLGLKLVTDEKEVDIENSNIVVDENIDNVVDFGNAINNTFFSVSERKHMIPSYWERSVPIKIPNIPATQFNISSDTKRKLVKLGYSSMKKFLKK